MKSPISQIYHTINGKIAKGWLVQSSIPVITDPDWNWQMTFDKKKYSEPLLRGLTPADAIWMLYKNESDARNVGQALRAKNPTMKIRVAKRNRLRLSSYYN